MVVLGRLVTPYGVKGWLHLHPFGDDPASWRHMAQWWLAPADGDKTQWSATKLSGLRQHGGGWVAKLESVDSREAAEALAGWYFAAPREELPATENDEYYWADLIGLRVINLQGEQLGLIETLIETGANNVLKLCDGDKEHLLPFVEQVVKKVDIAGGCMTVDWQADW
ncbi:Ribosome maturation factor RimM [Georgfuchsia toluolica]|uniref:Ribosome maturation factor RimM n=1 Tax=Georgfuchsia toluolica TaxID=424218 RepID=A0A916N279_9PROT|nr:ribosome maturation factor RimM [Georgfuchsia toluolica]CAG4883539.1 Ribosome maturation factor RimM [Georgfuchsia toluolica]